jgi:hypothetical protein
MKIRLAPPVTLLAALFAGCTAIGHERVEGWPALQIVEHHVPHHEMRDRCARYTGFGMSPEACAEFDLVHRKCHIWYSADFPPQKFIVEHERLHCAGYDHAGSNAMARWLQVYLASQATPSAAAGASR